MTPVARRSSADAGRFLVERATRGLLAELRYESGQL
jgi:hypothetical protein